MATICPCLDVLAVEGLLGKRNESLIGGLLLRGERENERTSKDLAARKNDIRCPSS